MAEKICSVCGFPLKIYYFNADPLSDGVCCQKCFQTRVVPAREEKIAKWERESKRAFSPMLSIDEKKEDSVCPTKKVCYEKKEDAEFALYLCNKENKNGDGERQEKHIYFCKLCNKFHLTSHDQLPSWRDRNKKNNYNYSRPAKYIPAPRQENWENDRI